MIVIFVWYVIILALGAVCGWDGLESGVLEDDDNCALLAVACLEACVHHAEATVSKVSVLAVASVRARLPSPARPSTTAWKSGKPRQDRGHGQRR